MRRILVIDDDTKSRELLTGCFKTEGFQITSVDISSHDVMRSVSRAGQYDLVVLSMMLSGLNGFEVLKSIRPRFATPVLMLTTHDKKVDGVIGLEMGADAFILKPFNPRELLAYARAILRRTLCHRRRGSTPGKICVGDVELDTLSREVRQSGVLLHLTPAEFGFLEILLGSAGQVIKSEHLAERVLGCALAAYDRRVSVHMGNLRKKLGHRSGQIERIVTIRGRGYMYANPQLNANWSNQGVNTPCLAIV